jgi:acyl-coenzyme A thioesterase PaaI-like protein
MSSAPRHPFAAPGSRPFHVDLGYRSLLGLGPGTGTLSREHYAPGTDVPLPSLLAIMGDNDIGGAITRANLPSVSLTTALSVTVLGPARPGPFVGTVDVLHNGNTTGTGQTCFATPAGPFALALGEYVRSPRPNDVLTAADLVAPLPRAPAAPPAELCDVRTVGPGEVHVRVTPRLHNGAGILHGGVHAVAAEDAALGADGRRPGIVVSALAVHFLRGIRTGTVRAIAGPLGTLAGLRRYRVELTDLDRPERLLSVSTVTCVG